MAVAVALALSAAAGCTHQRAATGTTTATRPAETTASGTTTASETSDRLDDCVGKRAKVVRFGVQGARLDGVVIGHGPVGVVLAHERGRDLCSWLPYAHHLARLGFTALAFDFKTYAADLVDSVVGAAGELRKHGADGILLIGASMGGTSVLDAARKVPGVLGVVSVSGPASFGDADAAGAVKQLRVPLLFIVGHDDSEFLGDARSLYRRARSADKRLEILPGFAHGTAFFVAPLSGRAVQITDRFVTEHSAR